MATTTPATPERFEVPLSRIRLVDENTRPIDLDFVSALARSIKLIGPLQPVLVRPLEDGDYALAAGYHRYHAYHELELEMVPVTFNAAEASAQRGAENTARKQLNPLEEAIAVRDMLADGFTAKGTAEALCWSVALVTARRKILELPEQAQQLVGTGAIPLEAIDTLLRIQSVQPEITAAITAAIGAGDVAGGELARDPAWTLRRALNRPGAPFAANLDQVGEREAATLKLGKKTTAALAEAEKLHRQLDKYAYGPPRIAFTDVDVDQARAAGVLLEFEGRGHQAPLICDRALYRELCKQAIARGVEDLRERVKNAGAEKRSTSKRELSPREELEREHRAAGREHARQAHGANLALGTALMHELANVDPASIDVARFFAYGLLGPETSSYLGTSDHVALTIAANGLRLVVDELRTETTTMLKSGKQGKTKIAYAEAEDAKRALWRWVDGAKSAGELYGRTIVVFAAQHYALQIALPTSKRRPSVVPRSHKDQARKAFEKLVKPALPGTYKQLQRAIATEAREHDKHVTALHTERRATDTAAAAAAEVLEHEDLVEVDDDLEHENVVDEDVE